MKKLLIYAIHPIMYQTPIFKELNTYIEVNNLNIQVTVAFGDDISLKEVYFDSINTLYKPDVPFLLDGYSYIFLKNYSANPKKGFFSRVNPGIIIELIKGHYDAILIHGYDNFTSWIALIFAKMTNTKVIWRGEAVLRGNENKKQVKKILKKILLRVYFRFCNRILFSCSGNKDYFEFYGVKSEKMMPIRCAVNNFFFQSEKEKYIKEVKNIKNDLRIDYDNLVILFVARFTKRKRPIDLLKAIKFRNIRKITVLFVGDGPEKKKMQEFAELNNINAVFAGFKNQTQIGKYYSISDICVVTSEYDPSPKVVNEAMNFSLPIIITKAVGTSKDLVLDGKNGFIIKVGDFEELGDKINFLEKNRQIVSIMGKKSYEIVQKWNYYDNSKWIVKSIIG